jgi:hypothetical protein
LAYYKLNSYGDLLYSINKPEYNIWQSDNQGNLYGRELDEDGFQKEGSRDYILKFPIFIYRDIPTIYWAFKEIDFLKDTGIIRGYPNGKFYADVTVTRAQTAIMLARALKLDTENAPDPNFSDISPEHYAYKEIAAVAQAGIFQGNNGKFDPESKLTRAEMAAVLTRAYNLSYSTEKTFTDLKNKKYWAYDAIQALAENGITAGYTDGTFRPEQPLPRAQFAVFMARILDDKFKK